ncbi:acetyl-CoA C-acetyltransferase [Morganella psychrotolerans]|uniref:Acetyl-CoA C-acetyltransferase n=1 Tax=Morganella psychrotolerans TaxID=368603 RepID=A0A5M9R256_9GAMM|nr:acetyl-CoA C-acetyltransferase [Morganella psychrotolerans]KAA8714232.1 acetyl-CoA C-acetyltransferase [Morganella psychrotolerans]OBU04013.1 acetyl-CoA acetyltransferase [Morganella psychrotolerans]
MNNIVIVGALRTAIGSFNGALADVSAVELGTTVVGALLRKTELEPGLVDEVIMGNVLQAGTGQNPARQIQINSGIPDEVCSYTVNKLCGSGLKSVALGVQAISNGDADIIIAGGTENMSQAPYLLDSRARKGLRLGDGVVQDSLLKDGLMCSIHGYHMGVTAENIAKAYHLSREDQDAIALASQLKAESAITRGAFKAEIVPVTIKGRKGDVIVDTDEFPKAGSTAEGLMKLRPAFDNEGTVTAGNASGINDGAAALMLMTENRAKSLGLVPLARVRGYASGGVAPALMGLGPVPATRKVLEKTGLSLSDIDLIEANEAFAAQFLAVGRELGFDPEKVNINGGAIALGHPIGASGARVLVTLLHALQAQNKTLGLATLCIGGGQGISMVIERLQ